MEVNDFLGAFDYKAPATNVVIDLSHAHLWDGSAIAAIDKVVLKYRRNGVEAKVVGMNEASATLLGRLAIHDKPGTLDHVASH